MTLRIRHSNKMINSAMASSPCVPVTPSTKTKSRPNDVRTIIASNI